MSQETRKVLDLLAEGKIGAADAERLLEKLENAPGGAGESREDAAAKENDAGAEKTKRYLRIVVDEPGRKPVNLRMPLTFARAGLSMAGILPKNVAEKLKEHGIDVGVFRSHGVGKDGKDNDVDVLKQLDLDIDNGDGKKVRIFCE